MILVSKVAMTSSTTQTVAATRRPGASRYIHRTPKTRATIPIRQIPRTKTSHSAPRIWNAVAMGPQAERSERYFMVARARPGDASRFRRRDFPRRAVRVCATDRRVTHAVLETAVLALDPDSG